jgi:hypothetical protein
LGFKFNTPNTKIPTLPELLELEKYTEYEIFLAFSRKRFDYTDELFLVALINKQGTIVIWTILGISFFFRF